MEPSLLAGLAVAFLSGGGLLLSILVDNRRNALRARINQVTARSRGSVAVPALSLNAAPRRQRRPLLVPDGLRDNLLRLAPPTAVWVKPLDLMLAASVAFGGVFVSSLFLGLELMIGGPLAIVAGAAAPWIWLRISKNKYDRTFLAVFPDALDLMVRAVIAGLPAVDAMGSVGEEISEPVGSEFRKILAEMSIGAELETAVKHAAEHIRITEFNFFLSSIVLQRQTGGNLAETLRTLSRTIRRRNELRLKIRALSAEGRASARLLGGMPVFMGGAIYFIRPSYIAMLFTDPRGVHLLVAAVLALLGGLFTLQYMIRRVVK